MREQRICLDCNKVISRKRWRRHQRLRCGVTPLPRSYKNMLNISFMDFKLPFTMLLAYLKKMKEVNKNA